jgi:beta-glucosidase
VMIPDAYQLFIPVLLALTKSGAVPQARIDEAVRRILTAKFALGLFEKPLADESMLVQVGSAEHRAVAREAVRKSVVLLKNEHTVLPLAKNLTRVHVVGQRAKDLGSQCGGWTITWQGQLGSITDGTTIFEAIKQAVAPETNVTYSPDGTDGAGADVIIAVIGELPYAEMKGDNGSLALYAPDQKLLANAQQSGVPVIAVLLSGRPLLITDVLPQTQAFIAAWLPGTEGQGVADVLFGDYAPTGKLSFTWPRSLDQLPINVGDGKTDPLFPFGFGLTY